MSAKASPIAPIAVGPSISSFEENLLKYSIAF